MNILHILDERWDSGLTAYGLSLASALQKRGHRVEVAARPGAPAFREAQRRGLPAHTISLGFRRLAQRGKFDLLNAHTGSGHVLAWWAALGRSMALVRTRADARSVKRNWGHRRLYERTDAVIGASGWVTRQYRSLCPETADRLWTVYPGREIPPCPPEPEGPLRIAVVGRLDPVKGHAYFLEALSHLRPRLRDEQFLIVGEETNLSRAELQRSADTLQVSRWVRFLGRQEDMDAFMRSCHVGVVASVGSEAVSRVCLEWLSLGRPVVATAVGCLPELISTGENGFLVPPRSPRAMANCFLGLIEHGDFRRDMGRRAHETARERFSLERFARETEKVYEAALARRRSSRPSTGG